MSRPPLTLVWLRQDLRLRDNPALLAAVRRGGAVVPVYILDEGGEAPWAPGAASRWWLHESLQRLHAACQPLGSRLILRRGAAAAQLLALASECGADALYWNRRYEPAVRRRDAQVELALRSQGVQAVSHAGALLVEPGQLLTRSGTPFQVFTPFWRRLLADTNPATPQPAPRTLRPPATWPPSLELPQLQLLPPVPWHEKLAAHWSPGEAGAQRRLQEFLASALPGYDLGRDLPAMAGTSRLSAHLHHGEVSARQVWHGVLAAGGERSGKYLSELIWREFSYHLLHHFPHTTCEPLRAPFARFPWREDAEALHAWQRGQCGIPLVDAGMRQLWTSGWMHNRVRMISASFLVKNLRLPWQQGARWFWDTLVDADLAANTQGWQWVAGCGADAAPYFRVFNPVTQGQRFDPRGEYLRRWLPELARLPDSLLHTPWRASAEQCRAAGVVLGRTYPFPIVDLAASRRAALDAYRQLRQ